MSYDTYFDTFMAVLAAFLSFFFGGLDSLMTVLLVFVACDIISGIIKGLALGKFSSDVGFRGISKKVFMFMFIGVANVLDHELFGKSEVLRDGVVMFYLANEGLSIIENAIDMGAPVPEIIKERFVSWRNKELTSKNTPDIEDD